ncbi:uncharacterized protein [Euwallacea fornicatus]|uniref:uncharacterized protein n=1 Tax=Euwallacea fornicatus TaxID=995702 RepID=UPI003390503E
MWIMKVHVICAIYIIVYCEYVDCKRLNIVQRTFDECFQTKESFSCLSEKAARALEKAMDWNVPLIDGMNLLRNNQSISHRQARLLGFDHLSQAIKHFFQTHVISLELGGATNLGRKGDGGVGSGFGSGFFNKKAMRKEGRYVNYAFMVLLGIFGLTGPLVMKILALMAAKSILAAKAALIIVGSVALKKLFEKDHTAEPAVKVHTINHDDDDHDRVFRYGLSGYGYENYSKGQNSPYAGYYDEYYKGNVARENT